MTKFSKHLKIILTEMCKRVGAKFRDVDLNKEKWFMDYEWTEEEQDDYKKWLIDYIFTNTEARKELMCLPYRTKRVCKEFASYFLFQYGWKFKDERKTD